MADNQDQKATRRRCRRNDLPEVRVVSAVVSDAPARLHRAYELVLLAAGRHDEEGSYDISARNNGEPEDSKE